jgi:hypothetical protein
MISEHAQRIGLIPPSALGEVITEIEQDQQRPGTGEQAVRDAVAAILPE